MIKYIKHIHIFSDLEDGEIKLLVNYCSFLTIHEQEILFEHGDQGNELYIIIEGMIQGTIVLPNGSVRNVAEIGPGDFVGEIALFDKVPRSATCIAIEKSVVLCITDNDFNDLINHYPQIANKIMYRMMNITIERFRDTSNFLADIVQWGENARKRTITDELTGIYNRRFLDDALVNALNQAKNMKAPFAIIMMDIDWFRKINDQVGHTIGDKIIKSIVEVYIKLLHQNDIIARFGGDEFTILLPDADITAANELAEVVRHKVTELNVAELKGTEFSLSISQGIAAYPKNGSTITELKEAADSALYKAKDAGRNRVVCSE